jgi:hypothetical protein
LRIIQKEIENLGRNFSLKIRTRAVSRPQRRIGFLARDPKRFFLERIPFADRRKWPTGGQIGADFK